MTDPDIEDVRLTLQGDGDAYRRIVERHQQEIAKRMRRFTRDRLALDELVHDAFVQAYLSLRSYRGDAPLIAWLHRIAVRTGYRFWSARDKLPKDASLDHVAARSVESTADSEAIDRALAKLSPRDRLVVTLMYLDGHSVAETAKLTGWSQTMVKVQAFRARGKLKALMEQSIRN